MEARYVAELNDERLGHNQLYMLWTMVVYAILTERLRRMGDRLKLCLVLCQVLWRLVGGVGPSLVARLSPPGSRLPQALNRLCVLGAFMQRSANQLIVFATNMLRATYMDVYTLELLLPLLTSILIFPFLFRVEFRTNLPALLLSTVCVLLSMLGPHGVGLSLVAQGPSSARIALILWKFEGMALCLSYAVACLACLLIAFSSNVQRGTAPWELPLSFSMGLMVFLALEHAAPAATWLPAKLLAAVLLLVNLVRQDGRGQDVAARPGLPVPLRLLLELCGRLTYVLASVVLSLAVSLLPVDAILCTPTAVMQVMSFGPSLASICPCLMPFDPTSSLLF